MQSFLAIVVVLLFTSLSSLLEQEQQVSAFSLNTSTNPQRHQTTMTTRTISTRTARTTSQLYYNIITPPDDDNCDVDGSDCEESVFDRKKREQREKDQGRRELYAKKGLDLDEMTKTLSAIDQMATPDQFDNAAGGGIIPGMQMSALMEDD